MENPSLGSKKYVLCCPQEGFNDQLNQLWWSYRYARRTQRVLLVDTKNGSLGRAFSDVFELATWLGDQRQYIQDFSSLDPYALDQMTTHPPALSGKVSSYRTEWPVGQPKTGTSRLVLEGTNEFVSLTRTADGGKRDWQDIPDFAAQLVLHHSGGGGNKGKRFLELVKLKPALATQVLAALATLPKDLVACHIRQTDMSVDAGRFLEALNQHVAGRPVLICSDDAALRAKAEVALSNAGAVIFASDLPDLKGARLHGHPSYWSKDEALVALLVDLFAMASASEFVFPHAYEAAINVERFSGFAVLADNLRLDPTAQKSLLSLGDPKLLTHVFRDGPSSAKRRSQLVQKLRSAYPEMTKIEERRKKERTRLNDPTRWATRLMNKL